MHEGDAIDRLEGSLRSVGTERVAIGTLLDRFGNGAWGLLLLLLGAAGLVPGVAPVFGIALVLCAAGLAAGREQPWLPQRLRRVEVNGKRLLAGLQRLRSYLAGAERLARSRRAGPPRTPSLRLAGAAALLNGVLVVLPIPFGNAAPAIATIILGIGLAARNAAAVAAGLGASLLALAIDAALLWLGYQTIVALLTHLF